MFQETETLRKFVMEKKLQEATSVQFEQPKFGVETQSFTTMTSTDMLT